MCAYAHKQPEQEHIISASCRKEMKMLFLPYQQTFRAAVHLVVALPIQARKHQKHYQCQVNLECDEKKVEQKVLLQKNCTICPATKSPKTTVTCECLLHNDNVVWQKNGDKCCKWHDGVQWGNWEFKCGVLYHRKVFTGWNVVNAIKIYGMGLHSRRIEIRY